MTCGIYCIQNTINQKKYIGLSTNIEKRLKEHLRSLRNKNTKQENEHFIRSFHKYGEDSFQARIIIVCNQNILAPMEQYLIKIFKTYNPKFGYNKTLGGERNQPTIETQKKMSQNHADVKGKNNPFYGRKHSDESKKKMSESQKGKYIGENHPLYGKHHSDETRKKISESLKGKKISDESRKKMSKPHKGRKISDETRKKISESLKGRKISDETRKKISESLKGKRLGENNPSYNHNIPNGLELLKEKEQGAKITDLAIKYNCSRKTIRNRINKVL